MRRLALLIVATVVLGVACSFVLADPPVKTKVSPITITVRASNVKIRLLNGAQFARPTAQHPIELPAADDRHNQVMWYTITDTTLEIQTAGAVETRLKLNVETTGDALSVQADSSDPKKLDDDKPILKFDSAGHGEIHDTETGPRPISVTVKGAE